MGALKKAVVIRQFAKLPVRRLDQLIATVSRIDAPQSGHAVKNLVIVGVVNIHAVRTRNDAAFSFAQLLVVCEWMKIVIAIEVLPFGPRPLFDDCHGSPQRNDQVGNHSRETDLCPDRITC